MSAQLNLESPVQVLAPDRRRPRAPIPEHIIPGFARPPAEADAGIWASAFEDAYSTAQGDLSQVPWCRAHPDRSLVSWIDSEAPGIVRPGATVAIAGCGAGDDAAELASRGYDVTALDVSPTAISWAQRRFPHLAECFQIADVLALTTGLRRRADLVVAVELLTWLPPALRQHAAESLVAMARPRGMVLVVCTAPGEVAPVDSPAAPPFPLMPEEVCALMAPQGLSPLAPLDRCVVLDSGERRLCAAFRRS